MLHALNLVRLLLGRTTDLTGIIGVLKPKLCILPIYEVSQVGLN